MANVTAYVGGVQKVEGENQNRFYGDCWVSGQSEEAGISWTTEPVTIGANLLSVRQAIVDAIEAAADENYSFNPLVDNLTILGGPSAL